MPAPFPRWTNTGLRLAILALALTLLGGPALLMLYMRTPYITMENNPVTQPVMFDHRHHVRDDGIDCRYCHQTVETQAHAGIPSTQVCLGCHSQIWTSSPLLKPVHESARTNLPIAWRRVHVLPDHVYFDHSVHITAGVTCARCHGQVDQMAQVAKAQPLTMKWCIDCHRDPQLGGVTAPVHCSACHR